MINIIISVKGLQKISDRLYIRDQISNKYQINGEMHVNFPSLLNLVQSVIIINAKYVN